MHITHEISTSYDGRGSRTTTFIHAESDRIEPSVGYPPVGNTLTLDIGYPGGLCCLFMTTEQAMGVAIGILEALYNAEQKAQEAQQQAPKQSAVTLFPNWLADAMEKSRKELRAAIQGVEQGPLVEGKQTVAFMFRGTYYVLAIPDQDMVVMGDGRESDKSIALRALMAYEARRHGDKKGGE